VTVWSDHDTKETPVDPNQTLATIRKIIVRVDTPFPPDTDERVEALKTLNDFDDLVNAIDALDSWLSKGGALPAPWER
jgi:hypothetical protein